MKHNLTDCTFIIPFSYDHPDRIANLKLISDYLLKHFETYVIIAEINTTEIKAGVVHLDYSGKFHRTKALNHLTNMAETPYVINWDCDVLCDPLQLVAMAERLRAGVDMVYPYDGHFCGVNRKYLTELQQTLSIDCLKDGNHRGFFDFYELPVIGVKGSVGGAVGFNKERYMAIGGENENFVSWGPEDVERYWRAKLLGLSIERVPGCIYHIDHWRGDNSNGRSQDSIEAHKYWEWLQQLTRDEVINHLGLHDLNMRGYAGGWKLEDAIKEHAFSLELAYHISSIIEPGYAVIDLGCGPGFYSQFLHLRGHYVIACDFGETSEISLFKDIYRENILDVTYHPKEVVLCLEVGEHVPKEDEQKLLDKICSHATKKIILSWAVPGQGGFGHTNCQPNSYIIEQMKARGWSCDVEASDYLRQRCSGCTWFEDTLMVFNPIN